VTADRSRCQRANAAGGRAAHWKPQSKAGAFRFRGYGARISRRCQRCANGIPLAPEGNSSTIGSNRNAIGMSGFYTLRGSKPGNAPCSPPAIESPRPQASQASHLGPPFSCQAMEQRFGSKPRYRTGLSFHRVWHNSAIGLYRIQWRHKGSQRLAVGSPPRQA
jgi:hypothetical protein